MSQKKIPPERLEALRTPGKKLHDINESSMRKVKFHYDQNEPSLQKIEYSMPWYNNERKETKRLMRKARNNLFMHSNSLTNLLHQVPSMV